MKGPQRIYADQDVLYDWSVPPFAYTVPVNAAARAAWGWQQDDDGRWYREVPAGEAMSEMPGGQ
jgi:hypothetical protein